jgi:hypothetical protein
MMTPSARVGRGAEMARRQGAGNVRNIYIETDRISISNEQSYTTIPILFLRPSGVSHYSSNILSIPIPIPID